MQHLSSLFLTLGTGTILIIIIIALDCIQKGHLFYTITARKRSGGLSSDRKIGVTSRSFQRSYSTNNHSNKALLLEKPAVTYDNFISDFDAIMDAVRGKSYIYKLTNNKTGEMYIGQSTRGSARMYNYRWDFLNELKTKRNVNRFRQNILKHGLDNFSFSLLKVVGKSIVAKSTDPKDIALKNELNTLETQYIIEYTREFPKLILNVKGKYDLSGDSKNKYVDLKGTEEKIIDLDFTPVWVKNPVFSTNDMLTDRPRLKEVTENRTTVYAIVNLYTGETYIGSSLETWGRFSSYYTLASKGNFVGTDMIAHWGHNNVAVGILVDFGHRDNELVTLEQLRFFEQVCIEMIRSVDKSKILNTYEALPGDLTKEKLMEIMYDDDQELFNIFEDVTARLFVPVANLEGLRSAGNIPDAIFYKVGSSRKGGTPVYIYEVMPNGELKFLEVLNSMLDTDIKYKISRTTIKKYLASNNIFTSKVGVRYRFSKNPLENS